MEKILLLFTIILMYSCHKKQEDKTSLQFVDFNNVSVTGGIWKQVQDLNREVTVHDLIDKCYAAGTIRNLEIAAGVKDGEIQGVWFSDEHLYKTIEAASFSLMLQWDEKLAARLDTIIDLITKAQEPDGYLNFQITSQRRKEGVLNTNAHRYVDLKFSLETYCMGHLIEAAIAHKLATGKDNLYNVGVKAANHLVRTFGKDKLYQVDGHEVVEMALMRLYEYSGNPEYFNLAKFFIDARGDSTNRKLFGEFFQDHKPFIEQTEAVGQAPRATYLYSGAADVAFYDHNPAYIKALNTLWDDVTQRHLYLNGGIGSKHENEGFGEPYDLPNLTNYTEICAAVSMSMWNTRMFRLDPDAKYFDFFELTLYNNLIAGVSQEGNNYFYPCAMESDGKYKFNLGFNLHEKNLPYNEPKATRKEWFPCACCPPTLARYIPQVPGYMYAVKNDSLFVNLFIDSKSDFLIDNNEVSVIQKTGYPWDNLIAFSLHTEKPLQFTLLIRIPSWARNSVVPGNLYSFIDTSDKKPLLKINGENQSFTIEKGYAVIRRHWKKDDKITLELPMKTRKVVSDEKIVYNRNKTAVMYGPVLYCFESADGNDMTKLAIAKEAKFERKFNPDLLKGTWVLKAKTGMSEFMAIPYYKWSNRGENEMKVWVGTHN